MTGLVLICKPDGTQTLVERELPELEYMAPEPTTSEVLNTLLGVNADE